MHNLSLNLTIINRIKAPYQGRVYIQTTEHNIETKINEGQQLGKSINYARELSQMPPNILTPQYFAEEIKAFRREFR